MLNIIIKPNSVITKENTLHATRVKLQLVFNLEWNLLFELPSY